MRVLQFVFFNSVFSFPKGIYVTHLETRLFVMWGKIYNGMNMVGMQSSLKIPFHIQIIRQVRVSPIYKRKMQYFMSLVQLDTVWTEVKQRAPIDYVPKI